MTFRGLTDIKIWSLLALLVLLRFLHLDPTIDDPHAWRQYDTKQYIEGYYYDNAPFLEPTVCWMGQHKTLILEFPLPEYMVAQLFKVFGPHLIVARLFFLVFFFLALYYFYRSLQLVFEEHRIPIIATFIAGVAPLSLYYSRAIHIDFFAIALAMGMLYFALKAIRTKHFPTLIISLFCGTLGMLVKAPYVFYLSLPIIYFAFMEGRFKWFMKRAPIYLIPVALLFAWVSYVKQVNASIPDWDFIPNFNKFTDMSYWYFGNFHQRTVGGNWVLLGERIYAEILSITGLLFLTLGLLLGSKNMAYRWSLIWLLGTILYACIFFNLNVKHNYYQLPFVFSCAIIMARGIVLLGKTFGTAKNERILLQTTCIGLFFFQSLQYAETNYYTVHQESRLVAKAIREFTSRDDAIIVCYGGLTPQCPLILQEAQRYGWSIPVNDFSPELAHQLYVHGGANTFAIYVYGYFEEGTLRSFYEYMKVKKSVQITPDGWVLYLCELDMDPPK